jgi:hypothetical protein
MLKTGEDEKALRLGTVRRERIGLMPFPNGWHYRIDRPRPIVPPCEMLLRVVEADGNNPSAAIKTMVRVREAWEAAERRRSWTSPDTDEAMIQETFVRHHVTVGWLDVAAYMGWPIEELFGDRVLGQLGDGEVTMVTSGSIVVQSRRTKRLVRIGRPC